VKRGVSRAGGFLFRRRRRGPGSPGKAPSASVFPFHQLRGSGSRGME
jgi:hypothetical protein